MIEVTRRVVFAAAHHLPSHPGACRYMHGHNWVVEVTCRGALYAGGPAQGMVIDMGEVKHALDELVTGVADHADLNEVMPAGWLPPTTEHVAGWVGTVLVEAGLPVARVTVRETENQWATWYAPERGAPGTPPALPPESRRHP